MLPPLPAQFAAEVEALERAAEHYLQLAVPSRNRHALDDLGECFTARTAKSRAAGLCADPDLTAWALALRRLGERLFAIGGEPLLETVVARLAPPNTENTFLRAKLLRTAWHQLGEHLR